MTWHGARLQLFKGRSGQITDATGRLWMIDCHHDNIEQNTWCSVETGAELSFSLWEDGNTAVSWGMDRMPGSAMVGRFEGGQPFSTTAKTGFNEVQSKRILNQMLTHRRFYYRWTAWPSDLERGDDDPVDLAGFPAVLELAKAVLVKWGVDVVTHGDH